jgi:hypothetical protein
MGKALRGELTDIKKEDETFSLKNSNMVRAIAQVLKTEEESDYKLISQTIEPVLLNSVASTVRVYWIICAYREI